ncbi:MAG: hypothetical protein ACE5I9_05250 [Candidatus Methylomirabilales bacterium]
MKDKKDKKIHIRLSENLHKKLRIKCAFKDATIQEYVEGLVREDLAEYRIEDEIAEFNEKKTKRRA